MIKTILKTLLLPLLVLANVVSTFSQVNTATSDLIISSLERLKEAPVSIIFQNNKQINNQGGHLQGIQYINYEQNDYYVLSGSSGDYSYYSVVKTGKDNLVISINKIMEKPFKHAGGFQIFKNLMAIGVEDNDAKNRSKVFIFNFNNPEKPPEEPLAIIDRMGASNRATAGCVGITIHSDKVLVVVGDWDTEHLDFYRIDRKKLGQDGETLKLEYSIDTRKMDKTGWIDEKWLAYQNVNFIQDDFHNLYLAGMTSDENDENILDLYKIETSNLSSFKLLKIYTRKFKQNERTKFRWGAGVYVMDDHRIILVSCGEHIEENVMIHIYE